MTARLWIVAIVMGSLAAPAACALTTAPAMKTVPYEAWGIRFDVPRTARKVALKPGDDVQLWDLYPHGDFVYFLKIVRIPADTLTSTVIEQDIQAEAGLFSKRGPTKRWEMNEGLYKALNYYARADEDIPEAAAELGKVLRGRTAFASCVWTALDEDTSPMLLLGVVGPKGRDEEIESLARWFVNGVVRVKPGEPGPSAPPSAASPPEPRPPASAPKPRPALKKGDIEILGRIQSVSSDGRSLVMQAERITLYGMAPTDLDPPRAKTVVLTGLPKAAADGARIVVIGKNKGVGEPIAADWLEVTPAGAKRPEAP